MKQFKEYLSDSGPIPAPTVGDYRKFFILCFLLACACVPLFLVLEGDSVAYTCSEDKVARERIQRDILESMATPALKSLAATAFLPLWLQVVHPDLSIGVRNDVLFSSTRMLSVEVADVTALRRWFSESKDNQAVLLGSCASSVSLSQLLFNGFSILCQNSTEIPPTVNVTLPPALELEFKNTLNQSVIVSDVRSIRNFTVDEVYDNFFPPIPNGVVCAQAMGQLTLLQSTITTCFELEGAVTASERLAGSVALRCSATLWYEGVRWLTIFSLKTLLSLLATGTIVAVATLCICRGRNFEGIEVDMMEANVAKLPQAPRRSMASPMVI